MAGRNNPGLVALSAHRESVIDALSTHFANDALGMDEFEQRVDLAHRATSIAELDQLFSDLEPLADPGAPGCALAPTDPRGGAVARAAQGAKKRLLTILSSSQRKGTWRVPAKMRVVTVMGAVDLDFREAQLGPGVTEVELCNVMGAVAIVVPPHLQVECDGLAIMSHFESMDRIAPEADAESALLRITGISIMASVEMSTRPVGEPMKLDPNAEVGQIGHR